MKCLQFDTSVCRVECRLDTGLVESRNRKKTHSFIFLSLLLPHFFFPFSFYFLPQSPTFLLGYWAYLSLSVFPSIIYWMTKCVRVRCSVARACWGPVWRTLSKVYLFWHLKVSLKVSLVKLHCCFFKVKISTHPLEKIYLHVLMHNYCLCA